MTNEYAAYAANEYEYAADEAAAQQWLNDRMEKRTDMLQEATSLALRDEEFDDDKSVPLIDRTLAILGEMDCEAELVSYNSVLDEGDPEEDE